MKYTDNRETGIINYSGIFLTCFLKNINYYTQTGTDHMLVYVSSGKLIIDDGTKESEINPGECVFIRRDHKVRMTKQSTDTQMYQGITLVFSRNLLRTLYNSMDKANLPQKLKVPEGSIFKIPTRPDITSLFRSLTPYFDTSVQPTDEIISLKQKEGILCLININKNFYPVLFDFAGAWKTDIFEFINENYMYDLSIEEMAAYTGRSLATFKREFARLTNTTPQKYVIAKRLETAYELLKNPEKKVSDVYQTVGFKSITHFYTAYKKQYGYSPRKEARLTVQTV